MPNLDAPKHAPQPATRLPQKAAGGTEADAAHAGLLRLQRSAGNTAVVAMLAVQRYKPLARGATVLPKPSKQHEREMFESHDPDPTPLGDLREEAKWRYVTTSDPDLLASDDDSVVIQDTDKEPQEFYGSTAVVQQALKVLGDHDSLIGLEVGGATLDTTKTLTRVKAKNNVVPVVTKAEGEIESILDHICINFANVVLGVQQTGRRHEVVLHQTGHSEARDRRVGIISDTLRSANVEKLAGAMAGSPGLLHKKTAVTKMVTDGDIPKDTGERYGRRLDAGEMGDSAKRLGVNEYAQPEVGEAYATYSIKTEDGVNKDFSKLVADAPTIREAIWGYHYAGVVAESEDGKDKVTLENYNRSGDIYKAFVDKLLTDFGAHIAVRVNAAAQSDYPATELSAIYAELVGGDEQRKQESIAIFKAALTKSFVNALSTWYFRMYGTLVGSGQTFHERNVASGYFANPLTVRVGAPGDTRYDQATTRRYAKLAQVALSAPRDYEEDESRVRSGRWASKERLALSDYVQAAGNELDARGRLKDGLSIMADGQALAHFTYAVGLARKLDVSASKLPRLPNGAAGFDAAFDQIEQACAHAAGKLFVGKEKEQKLADAQREVVGVKAAVAGQFTYYAPHV